MPRTTIQCPNCRQPITADIEQLFDVYTDPSAKQRFLSGAFNIIQCPHCGYQGRASTPLVYHDPDKELLLTFVPPEIGLPRDEQEKVIGPLINRVMNELPTEKRKGYLLRPQATLTFQGMMERVLEEEGITREMLDAQQRKLSLIQRLANASPDSLEEIVKAEDELIDAEFFGLLRRLSQAALAGGDQDSARRLAELENSLVPITTFGRELQEQSREVETAMKEIREATEAEGGLSRERLLDMVSKAPNDIRLGALVSLARPAMDYQFFQMLSERIDRARGEGRKRLTEIREKLLEMTQEIDQEMENRRQSSHELLDEILKTEDVTEATIQSLPVIDEFFLQELNSRLENARKGGDLDQIARLQKVVDVLQQASAAPPEIALIEDLLEAPDEGAIRDILNERSDEITPEFLDALSNVVAQVQASSDQELAEQIKKIHRIALRFSMARNLG